MALICNINGSDREIASDPDTPLLWVLRDELRLLGTKFGCGVGSCGACTVHIDGIAARSCIVQVGSVPGSDVRTIEYLSKDESNPIQKAWLKHQVPQCGYCQSGMIMAAAALIAGNPQPSDVDIAAAMTNICRCATYVRIRAAIKSVAESAAL